MHHLVRRGPKDPMTPRKSRPAPVHITKSPYPDIDMADVPSSSAERQLLNESMSIKLRDPPSLDDLLASKSWFDPIVQSHLRERLRALGTERFLEEYERQIAPPPTSPSPSTASSLDPDLSDGAQKEKKSRAKAASPYLYGVLHAAFNLSQTPPQLPVGRPPSTRAIRALCDRELKIRRRSPDFNSNKPFADHIRDAKNILVLVGAGCSTSAGYPDYRTPKTGLLAQLMSNEYRYSEDEAEQAFSLAAFRQDPTLFYHAMGIFLRHHKDASPTPTHRFLRHLQDRGQLLRVYTQNVDGLELKAGITPERLVQCHGHLRTSRCGTCGFKIAARSHKQTVLPDLMIGDPVPCLSTRQKPCLGAVRPDIVMHGEPIPARVDECFLEDREKADLVIVLGTSLEIDPFRRIVSLMRESTTVAYVDMKTWNEGKGKSTIAWDYEMTGKVDQAVREWERDLDWVDVVMEDDIIGRAAKRLSSGSATTHSTPELQVKQEDPEEEEKRRNNNKRRRRLAFVKRRKERDEEYQAMEKRLNDSYLTQERKDTLMAKMESLIESWKTEYDGIERRDTEALNPPMAGRDASESLARQTPRKTKKLKRTSDS